MLFNGPLISLIFINIYLYDFRTMSSKRKNTPTKLSATDEHMYVHKDNYQASVTDVTMTHDAMTNDVTMDNEHNSDVMMRNNAMNNDASMTNGHVSMESDSERSLSPQSHRDSESPHSDCERPRNKKQRLLQSVRDEEFNATHAPVQPISSVSPQQQQQLNLINNNLNKATPTTTAPLSDHSVTNNSHSNDAIVPSNGRVATAGLVEMGVMEGIRGIMGSEGSVDDKQRRLNDMIQQLQCLKESLGNQPEATAQVRTLYYTVLKALK